MTISDFMTRQNVLNRFTARRPSPVCPKCASRRTEVIGMSKDLRSTFLRCGACGAHSQVTAQEELAFAPAS